MFSLLHSYIPNSVLFSLGPITIYWYGLFVVTGIITGMQVIISVAKKYNISKEDIYDLGFYVIIFGIIGARIYSVFLDIPYYIVNPAQIIAVWNGGLAIHGAIIGGALALFFHIKKKKLNFWRIVDVAVPGLALGQAIGRWGNYFNQEIFGTPTTLPWGIPIQLQHRPLEYLSHEYFHPTFLYESILNLINFGILFYLHQKKKLNIGSIALIYLINYSIIRISMETLRTDSSPEFLGLRLPVLVSIILILGSIGLLRKRGLTIK